jgi:HPt (histidine-containing phosphotransfer) domain-containing protein
MPEMNGLEATQRIRSGQSAVLNPEVPIIAMTAHALQGDRERCLEAGMNDYITKPVSPQAISDILQRWLPAVASPDAVGSGYSQAEVIKPENGKASGKTYSLVFNKAAFLHRFMGDEDVARLIIEVFQKDLPEQIQVMKDFLASGDAAGVQLQAHSIKGASANVSGDVLFALAYELEKCAKAGNLDAVRARLPELEIQYNRLKDELLKAF